MSEDLSPPRLDDPISRRTLLRRGVAAAALAALSSCDRAARAVSARPRSGASANVRVSHDRHGVHIMPSVAANPRNPRQLLAACLTAGSPAENPTSIATYLSFDGGANWQNGGVPPLPGGASGDDPTVAFDALGRGYVCATSYAGGRAVYAWRTDDGGRNFSAPVTVVESQFCDHPWLTTAHGQTPSDRNLYVAWGAGTPRQRGSRRHPQRGGVKNALDFTRSTDGGKTFEAPRRILPESSVLSAQDAAPELAAGPHGLLCAASWWTTLPDPSGDIIGQAVAVCSTDGGHSFGAPVHLGSGSSVIQLPGNVRPNSDPTLAISPSGDAMYVAFPTHRPGAVHSDIVVTASHDRGRTWSSAVTATPADDVIYFQPNLAVDHAGRVAISIFALAHRRVNQVLLLSRPGTLRFRPPLQVTTKAFDPHTPLAVGKYGAWWIGDYQGITASAGGLHLVWNDTRTGKLELFADTVRP